MNPFFLKRDGATNGDKYHCNRAFAAASSLQIFPYGKSRARRKPASSE
jgi:hypothetical protein